MLTYNITIFSKNKQSIKFFFLVLNKIYQPKIYLCTNYKKRKTLIKKITILKSPHVNKNAQSQYEYRIFSKKLIISSHNDLKLLILLKKIKTKIFPEIKIKIKFNFNKRKKNNLLNPKNYFINSITTKKNITQQLNFKNIKIKILKPCFKIKNYLKILDCYGELNIYKNQKFK